MQAWQERRRKLQAQKLAEAERKQKEAELEESIKQEKLVRVREVADRAAALRKLDSEDKFENDIDEPTSYWDFAWRSLVLPGWGHFYLDRPVVGSLYMGGAAVLAGTTYETHRLARAAEKENFREVELNFLLSLAPALASLEVRLFSAYYANGNAWIKLQKKADRYHNSLYSLGIFYAVRTIISGGALITPTIALRVMSSFRADTEVAPALTDRERQILELLVRGKSVRNVAGFLGLSRHTVHGYIKAIYKKLEVHNRTELVLRAQELSLM